MLLIARRRGDDFIRADDVIFPRAVPVTPDGKVIHARSTAIAALAAIAPACTAHANPPAAADHSQTWL